MSIKQDYENYIQAQKAFLSTRMAHYWWEQEQRYVKPFRIYGPIYYVGDTWVCIHLIDTGSGLLLIDTGNTGATGMLVQAIWSLGFRPDDIKWVILPHAHLDHIGSALFLRNMFGCKLYLGEPDAAVIREHPEQVMVQDNPDLSVHLFEPDEIIRDGDRLTFGSISIDCKIVPGHTPGCVALFFDVEENGTVKRAGFFGGFGLNTLQADFLRDIGDPAFTARDDYLRSLARVRDEKVDIFLGNHTSNNDLLRKAELLRSGDGPNPFLDDGCWRAYLDKMRDACLALPTGEAARAAIRTADAATLSLREDRKIHISLNKT